VCREGERLGFGGVDWCASLERDVREAERKVCENFVRVSLAGDAPTWPTLDTRGNIECDAYALAKRLAMVAQRCQHQ
jgi:hypothetical protein